MSITRRALLAAPAALAAAGAFAQGRYPDRPVKVIIPYPPGGGADTVGRLLFGRLADKLGQQMVIDNRAGAGGTIAAALAARAAPDGYTILNDATAFSVNPSLYKQLPYDTLKDFEPVIQTARVPNLLLVHPSVPVQSVSDIVELARSSPGGLEWASSGNGTVQHMALELFRQTTGIRLNHVPYRGGGPALTDLMSGQVKFFFSNASSSTGHVKAGTVKAIAHTGTGRFEPLPDLAAVADTLPGFEAYEWNGVFVPAGTPAEIVTTLNRALGEVIDEPEIKARLAGLGTAASRNSPADFRRFVVAEIEKWSRVVREGNIKIE